MNARKIAILGGMGVAALALIGAGASATFTDSTHSNQTIQAGTMNVTLSSNAPGAVQSQDGKTVTLANAAPVNSTFKTAASTFEISNDGDITVQEVFIKGSRQAPGFNANDDALFNQTNVCVYSPFIDNNNPGGVVYDGSLSNFVSNGQQVAGPLAPGAKDHYTAEYYAGNVTTACGDETSPSLDNSAQGGTITPQVDLSYTG